eukprot:6133198-Pleurochrysis_carterae.AAC.2
MRRAGRGMHTGVSEEVCKSRRKKLAGIIGVEGSDQLTGICGSFVKERGKRGDEFADIMRCLGFATHGVRGFVSRVVINENEEVLIPSVPRTGEWAGNVSVNEPAGILWALASEHAEHPSSRPDASVAGASAVISGSRRRCEAPM